MFIFDKFIVELVTDLGPSSLTVLYSRLSFNKPLYTTRGLLVVAKSEKVASLSKPHDTYSSSCSVAHMTGAKTRVSFPLRAPLAYPQCFFKERPRGSTYQKQDTWYDSLCSCIIFPRLAHFQCFQTENFCCFTWSYCRCSCVERRKLKEAILAYRCLLKLSIGDSLAEKELLPYAVHHYSSTLCVSEHIYWV